MRSIEVYKVLYYNRRKYFKIFFGCLESCLVLCDNIKRSLLEAIVNVENVDDVIDLKSCTYCVIFFN
jgi:hypothetical protein